MNTHTQHLSNCANQRKGCPCRKQSLGAQPFNSGCCHGEAPCALGEDSEQPLARALAEPLATPRAGFSKGLMKSSPSWLFAGVLRDSTAHRPCHKPSSQPTCPLTWEHSAPPYPQSPLHTTEQRSPRSSRLSKGPHRPRWGHPANPGSNLDS